MQQATIKQVFQQLVIINCSSDFMKMGKKQIEKEFIPKQIVPSSPPSIRYLRKWRRKYKRKESPYTISKIIPI